MTSHQLAKKLLENKDVEIYIPVSGILENKLEPVEFIIEMEEGVESSKILALRGQSFYSDKTL